MPSDSIQYLNLKISDEDFVSGAKQILQHIRPTWKNEDIKFKVFTDGITNKLLGCSLDNGAKNKPQNGSSGSSKVENGNDEDEGDDEMVLVRLNGQGTDIIINRTEEQETFRVLSAAGLAPPVYCVFGNGMAYGFFPGKPLDEQSVREPNIQRLIAEEMVKLHAVRGPKVEDPPRSEYQQRTQAFLNSAPTHFDDASKQKVFVSTIPNKDQLQSELDDIVRELESLEMEIVFSHNDLLLKNIIYNNLKGTIRYIDYEYAFNNYEAYDIANHFAEYAGMDEVDYSLYPSKDEQIPWLRHYLQAKAKALGKPTDSVTTNDLERLYIQVNKCVCASHFFWGVWALIQAEHSTIDFDYVGYANTRLTEYFHRKEQFFPLQLPSL